MGEQVERLGVVDDIFRRQHHSSGHPVVVQGLVRIFPRIDPLILAAVHDRLRFSALNRSIGKPRIRFARHHYRVSRVVSPLLVESTVIDQVVPWADAMAARPLNLTDGPCWELALADTADGGSVVSLIASHAIVDGQGILRSSVAALQGSPMPPRPQIPTLGDDLRDAGWQLTRVIIGVARSLGSALTHPAVRSELFTSASTLMRTTSPPTIIDAAASWRQPTAVVEVDTNALRRAARAHRGSTTALIAAMAATVGGKIRGSEVTEVAIPLTVNEQCAHPTSGNQLALGVITVEHNRLPDLAKINDALSQLGQTSGAVSRPPGGMPAELLSVLGDRLATRLLGDQGDRDGLLTNLGSVPPQVRQLGTSVSLGVRALTQGHTQSSASRTRTSLQSWIIHNESTTTISVCAPDPAIADSAELVNLIETSCRHWGLTVQEW